MFDFHHPSKFFKKFISPPALLFTTLLFFLATESGMAASVDSTIHEGIVEYNRKNYEQAESSFSQAQKEIPDSPELNYNLANSHYKTGKYQEALQSYTRATAGKTTPAIKQRSHYNSGNVLFRMGKLEEAEKAYKKALEIDSTDMDAKFNLEFVREQLKKKDQEKEKQNKNSQSDGRQNKEQNPSQENREPEPKNAPPNGDQNPASANGAEQEDPPSTAEQQEAPSPAPSQNNSISKNQADHWLSSLEENLKKFRRKQADRGNPPPSHQSQDW